jgi:serpin B
MRMPAEAEAARSDAAARIGAWNATKHPDLTLRVVNRLFGEKTYRFEKAFLGTTQSRWRAPLEKVGYVQDAEAARARINGWVASETRDRIRDLIPRGAIDEETRLTLVNAVYFLGKWQQPFQRRHNEDRPFFVTPGQGVTVPMMRHQIVALPYGEADGVQVLEMPYREGPFAMTVVLPRAVDGLAALEARLDAPTFAAWIAALQTRDVRVRFPKFTIDPAESLALKPVLVALGMADAFDRAAADFTGIAAPPDPADRLCISHVFHKAFVKVDEQGTEATAASSVVMARVGAAPGPPPPPPPEFIADHPFLFFIRDTESGVILFAGRLADPR